MNASKEEALKAIDAMADIELAVETLFHKILSECCVDAEAESVLRMKEDVVEKMQAVHGFIYTAQKKLPSEVAYERERQRRASKPKLKSSVVPNVG
jgi:hypothetical protein